MKLTGDDSPLVADFVRSRKKAELRIELASLRKALDDRRTVEGWVFGRLPENRRVSVTAFDPAEGVGHRCEITLWEDGVDVYSEFAETPDEAFSAAAEWLRWQE